MEQLDYLIRTLTYKRSQHELELKTHTDNNLIDMPSAIISAGKIMYDQDQGKIEGLNEAINEIYKLVNELSAEI